MTTAAGNNGEFQLNSNGNLAGSTFVTFSSDLKSLVITAANWGERVGSILFKDPTLSGTHNGSINYIAGGRATKPGIMISPWENSYNNLQTRHDAGLTVWRSSQTGPFQRTQTTINDGDNGPSIHGVYIADGALDFFPDYGSGDTLGLAYIILPAAHTDPATGGVKRKIGQISVNSAKTPGVPQWSLGWKESSSAFSASMWKSERLPGFRNIVWDSNAHVSINDAALTQSLNIKGNARIEASTSVVTNSGIIFADNTFQYTAAATTVQDEGTTVINKANPVTFNFVGPGVTASNVGGVATITIPGGSGAGGSPDGSNTQVQFNRNNAFGASPLLRFDETTGTLSVGDWQSAWGDQTLGKATGNLNVRGRILVGTNPLTDDTYGTIRMLGTNKAYGFQSESSGMFVFTNEEASFHQAMVLADTRKGQTGTIFGISSKPDASEPTYGQETRWEVAMDVRGDDFLVPVIANALPTSNSLYFNPVNGRVTYGPATGGAIKVKDEGALLTLAATELNFVGTGVTATTSTAGAVTVTVPSTAVAVADEGTLLTSTAARLNFVGTGVTANATAGNVTITIPGSSGSNLIVADEGTVIANAATRFNFVGTGVTSTASGSNITVTIPGSSGLAVQDEGSNVVASANTVNFVGAGVTASNVGGVATVTIPGSSYALAVKDEGNTVSATANVINFVGTGVTATQASANNVTVTINSSSLTTQDEGTNIATATTKFNFVGAGVTATGVGNSDVTVSIPGNSVKVYNASGNLVTNNLKELRLNYFMTAQGNNPDNGVVEVYTSAGSGNGIPVAISNKGTLLTSAVTGINFLGSGVSAAITSGNNVSVTIPGATPLVTQDEGSNVVVATTTMNFVGSGVTASNVGGVATITIPGLSANPPLVTQDEGSNVVTATTTMNFVGAGVTATNVGGVATVTVPALVTQDEGADIVAVTDKINFVGAGVTATNVGGVATVTIPGTTVPPLITQDEGYAVVSSTTTLNFVGAGVTATNVGGVATITVPGRPALNIRDEGSVIATEASSINFVGSGVSATAVDNSVTVNIPGGDTLYDAGSGSGALTFNRNNGTIQKFVLTGSITSITITNIAPAQSFTIILNQTGGARTLTAPGFKFASGYKTLSTVAGVEDMLNIFFDGSTYYTTLTTGYVS